MSLDDLKNYLNTLCLNSGKYPNMFVVDFYRDLAFVVRYSDNQDNGEKVILCGIDLQLTKRNTYRIINCYNCLSFDNINEARLCKQLIDWYLLQEEFTK